MLVAYNFQSQRGYYFYDYQLRYDDYSMIGSWLIGHVNLSVEIVTD